MPGLVWQWDWLEVVRFWAHFAVFPDELDISCERKGGIKNDIKVCKLSNDKMELCTDRASLVAQS